MNNIIEKNLRTLRKANRFTQEQVSSYLGVKRSAYSNYESGNREAPIDVLEKACALFGCDLDMLFEDNPEILSCSFRVECLDPDDLKVIANFKEMVLNYIKMERLLA